MRKRADMPVGPHRGKETGEDTRSELPVVTLLLVAALLVAAYAAGGTVLDAFLP